MLPVKLSMGFDPICWRMGGPPSTDSVYEALRNERRVVDSAALLSLVDEVRSDLAGLGPLDPWLSAPLVTDVLGQRCQ